MPRGRCTRQANLGGLATSALAVSVFAVCALVGARAEAADGGSQYDNVWSRARLYAGDSDSIIDSVELSGRFQVDLAFVDAGLREHSEIDLRRLRLGVKVNFLDDFLFHVEADYDSHDGELVYGRLTDAYIEWSPSSALALTVGKHGAPFTLDGMTSSKELLTIDRSNLANNIWFTEEYIPGVSVAGTFNNLSYQTGFYSSGEINRGFGNSNGEEFWLGTIGYDFAGRLNAEAATLNLNLVENEADERNGFTRPLERVASLNFSMETDRWGLLTDISSAKGYLGQSDLRGFMMMPFYDIGRAAQIVARYTYVHSEGDNGVRFARYENELNVGRGDTYRELYLGANYYWYDHKLKLQSGLQYADMDDRAGDGGAYSGWAWTTGFRISW